MPIALKSGSLNFLEPSGPVQACNGIILPFLLFIYATAKKQNTLFYHGSTALVVQGRSYF
jgi:hypothetical protein